MRDYSFLKSKFSEKHTIDNVEYLEKYIKLILEYRLCESDEYTEKHHILPKSVFPEFENEDWNIIELKYEDHINAHLFLFKSINIPSKSSHSFSCLVEQLSQKKSQSDNIKDH